MARFQDALSITNTAAVSTVMSTAANATTLLTAGVYAVWCFSQNAYIDVGSPISTGLVVTTGYPVIPATAPVLLNIPQNFQIGFVSSSSGTFLYQQVG